MTKSRTPPTKDESHEPEGAKDSGASSYFQIEQGILEYWKRHKIFERSIEEKGEDKRWTFLDGPPFITGMPHYGTLLSSIPKDLFGRYWTMKGYRVRRVWGWDCHGLPAENKVENTLGLASKRDIEEKVGVKKFIEECKKYVNNVSSEWEWYVDHIGRWVDFTNAYRTMDRDYMESVMWVFRQMYDKGYIYKGLRVSLYCPHCSTPISNFEVAMDAGENYKEVTEPANTYKYKVQSTEYRVQSAEYRVPTFFLAWSTTPWTKLTTTALAVNPHLTYVTVEYRGERYILAESTLEKVFAAKGIQMGDLTILGRTSGQSLVGSQYEGHYDFYKPETDKKIHVVVADDFVTADEGTGIVTLAPYGEEDLKVMQRDNILIVRNIDDEGKLTENNPQGWAGTYYLKANTLVNDDLTARGLMFDEQREHPHTIAHCWRCHTRLFHNPQEAWYVDVQRLKPLMAKTNESVEWYPQHFKYGRFLKSMEGAPDWCISRSRYWGSPVPVWECACGGRFVPGSIAELESRAGVTVHDLHKPDIDGVTVPCTDCGKTMRRVPEVLDSWIEAGSASFAERHYPFNKSEKLEDFFPPDFITEYTGQIRAWFYVLHVIAAAIYERPAFKNVLVSGVILGTDGRKMSKNYKNYPDPRTVIEKYGGDALRLYLLGSPTMRSEDINISETEYRDQLRIFIIPLLNIWKFFETYAGVDGYDVRNTQYGLGDRVSDHILDRWLISRLNTTVGDVTQMLEHYDTPGAVASVVSFVDEWSRWHLRRSRERVGGGELTGDGSLFYETTSYVFETFLRLIAPLTPFHSEHLYRKLTVEDSVHLESWPERVDEFVDTRLEGAMALARAVCEVGHQVRKSNGWKVRRPLGELQVQVEGDCTNLTQDIGQIILDELNVKNIIVNGSWRYPLEPVVVTEEELAYEGRLRDYIREIQGMRKEKGIGVHELISIQIPRELEKYSDYIKRKVRADK